MKKYRMKDAGSGILRNILAVLVVMAIIGAITAPQAEAAAYWQAKYMRFAATAGETLATGDVVCIAAADGYAYKASADVSTRRPAVGVIGKGGATAATVEIVVSGVIAGMDAKSPGVRLFAANSDDAGGITATAPTNAQAIGWVMPGTAGTATSTTYFIDVKVEPSTGAGY